MVDAAFAGAGQEPGLRLWRIENLKPVEIPHIDGTFHTGDSYILLSTVQKPGSRSFNWNIHFWIGEESSQDEAGCAAYKSVELDESLGGGPVQYREVQGAESNLFQSYFKSGGGIKYAPGGVASGFRKVVKDVYEPRLLHCKGRRTVRVSEVPVSASSLNKGDVFILDLGLKLFIFCGPTANKMEKAKGIEVAQSINGDERSGRAEINHLDGDYNCPEFWDTLGGFVDPHSLHETDDVDAPVPKHSARLFHITDASGAVTFTRVGEEGGKLNKDQLLTNDVFLLHGKSNKVFLWIGRGASLAEKREATAHAVQYIKDAGLPRSTQIERVSEGVETSAFKSEFEKWEVPLPPKSAVAGQLAEVTPDVAALLSRKAIEDAPVDDGSGTLKIWVVHDLKLVPVDPSKYGQFYGGDSYVILYTYIKNRREEYIIYFWLGGKSSTDERGAAALFAKELDDQYGGRPVQVRVVQGKEPAHLRQLFKGAMIVHEGGHHSGWSNTNDVDTYDTDGVALFHIRGTATSNTSAVQVPEVAGSLNSEDAFVLITPTHAYVWCGSGSNPEEQDVSLNIATTLANGYNGTGDRVIESVVEGSEPAEFWAAIGGHGEYARRSHWQTAPRDPRLFRCSDAFGRFEVEEIASFEQDDLNNDDVFLLDIYSAVFMWIGSGSTANEKAKAEELAQRFISEATDGRDADSPIIRVHQGEEPVMFTAQFRGWDPRPVTAYVDPYAAKLAALQAAKEAHAGSSSSATHTLKSSGKGVPLTESAAAPAPAPAAKPASSPVKPAASPIKPAAAAPAPAPAPAPAAPVSGTYSYEALKAGVAGADPARKEEYLEPAEFSRLFGSDKATFAALPKWKRDAKKKELGLF